MSSDSTITTPAASRVIRQACCFTQTTSLALTLGDTPTPPSAFYPNNTVTIAEVGSENSNRAYYHPSVGMPGYVPGSYVAYNLISDAVPEPASWALMLLGFGGIGFAALRNGVAGAMA
jgi:hypothetical protein